MQARPSVTAIVTEICRVAAESNLWLQKATVQAPTIGHYSQSGGDTLSPSTCSNSCIPNGFTRWIRVAPAKP